MRHGARSAFTLTTLDQRTKLARAWSTIQAELVTALGGDPTPQEAEALQNAVAGAAEVVEAVLREGLEAAMNRHNR